MKRMTLDAFVCRSRKVHGDKFDYTSVQWVNARTPIVVGCPIHGPIEVSPSYHYLPAGHGCPSCAEEHRQRIIAHKNVERNLRTTEEFIRRAVNVHGNRYDYSKTLYAGSKNKVIITCRAHGDFEQRPDKHIGKRPANCPKCSMESRRSKLKGRYTFDYFLNNAEEREVPALLYMVEMVSPTERFHKIGITTTSVEQRFKSGYYHYTANIIAEMPMSLYDAFVREQQILSQYAKHKYIPDVSFGGRNECFSLTNNALLRIIEEAFDVK